MPDLPKRGRLRAWRDTHSTNEQAPRTGLTTAPNSSPAPNRTTGPAHRLRCQNIPARHDQRTNPRPSTNVRPQNASKPSSYPETPTPPGNPPYVNPERRQQPQQTRPTLRARVHAGQPQTTTPNTHTRLTSTTKRLLGSGHPPNRPFGRTNPSRANDQHRNRSNVGRYLFLGRFAREPSGGGYTMVTWENA